MSDKPAHVPSERIVSLDALRGFDMFWIVGGGAFFSALLQWFGAPWALALEQQLHHVRWDGFRFEDLIFPLFLFIVGTSLPFAVTRRLERGATHAGLYRHIIKRTVVLLLLGLIYNGLLRFDFDAMRYAGVLQRIAICYFFAAMIVLHFRVKGQAIWAAALLVAYWLAMVLIPVPGHGAGVLTPDGNLAGYVDRLLLPGRFCCYRFGDNEGILSTIPAVSTALLGVLAGHWLRADMPGIRKVQGLAAAGAACLVAGKLWGFVFPINKLYWSSSYVLFAGGWSFLLLALFYWVVDVKKYRKWAFPFIVIGLNPITIYVASGLFDFGMVAGVFVNGFIDHLGGFKPAFWALSVLAVRWLFVYFLYRQEIFIKA